MARLPVYVGSHRRQIGGSIFGSGVRTAIPEFFKNTAGVGVAGDMINRKISSRGEVKDIFKTHAKNQMKAFKRKLLVDDEDDDEERQIGGQLKRRKNPKPTQKSVNKRRMSVKKSTKKSTSQRCVHKQKRKRVINKQSKQKQKQSW